MPFSHLGLFHSGMHIYILIKLGHSMYEHKVMAKFKNGVDWTIMTRDTVLGLAKPKCQKKCPFFHCKSFLSFLRSGELYRGIVTLLFKHFQFCFTLFTCSIVSQENPVINSVYVTSIEYLIVLCLPAIFSTLLYIT